ncbi:hypothetical protein C0991_010371, partial [Blastosporella zonata]
MASIIYDATVEEKRVQYWTSSAVEVGSRGSIGGSTLMIFAETPLNVTFSGIIDRCGPSYSLTWTLPFHKGTSISIYGNSISINTSVLPVPDFQKVVLINGIPTTGIFTPQNNTGLFYKSPTLSEGSHSLNIPSLNEIYIDYILVTAGSQTKLLKETLLVDESDPTVSYEGAWMRSYAPLPSDAVDGASDSRARAPVGGSTMWTNTPGASFSFLFTGTSVTVFGVCERGEDFSNVDVYLDGNLAPKAIPSGDLFPQANCPWFSAPILSPGNHTIKFQLNHNDNYTRTNLIVDYFTYIPSFDSLAISTALNSSSPGRIYSALSPSSSRNQTPTTPTGARLAGFIFGGIGIIFLLSILVLRRRIFRWRPRPPAEVLPFALTGHRAVVAAKETSQHHESQAVSNGGTGNLPPGLRGILKKEAQTEEKATMKSITLDSWHIPPRRESQAVSNSSDGNSFPGVREILKTESQPEHKEAAKPIALAQWRIPPFRQRQDFANRSTGDAPGLRGILKEPQSPPKEMAQRPQTFVSSGTGDVQALPPGALEANT